MGDFLKGFQSITRRVLRLLVVNLNRFAGDVFCKLRNKKFMTSFDINLCTHWNQIISVPRAKCVCISDPFSSLSNRPTGNTRNGASTRTGTRTETERDGTVVNQSTEEPLTSERNGSDSQDIIKIMSRTMGRRGRCL